MISVISQKLLQSLLSSRENCVGQSTTTTSPSFVQVFPLAQNRSCQEGLEDDQATPSQWHYLSFVSTLRLLCTNTKNSGGRPIVSHWSSVDLIRLLSSCPSEFEEGSCSLLLNDVLRLMGGSDEMESGIGVSTRCVFQSVIELLHSKL